MLNEEFLNGLLGNEEVSAEDKIKQIIAEHEADTRGLLQKRDELLGSQKKLKEQIATFEAGKAEYETKISGLEEELKKNSSEEHKKYYETQLADKEAQFLAKEKALTGEVDKYKGYYYKSLRDKAIEEGVKNLNFVDGLKNGFIQLVLAKNDFEPQEIDGQLKFLNKEHHTIEEAINAFALTTEGKAYIRNASTGGGATGSQTAYTGSVKNNPWKKGSENLTEQSRLFKENPELAHRMMSEAGYR